MIINHYKHRINKNICDTHLAHDYISQINLIEGGEIWNIWKARQIYETVMKFCNSNMHRMTSPYKKSITTTTHMLLLLFILLGCFPQTYGLLTGAPRKVNNLFPRRRTCIMLVPFSARKGLHINAYNTVLIWSRVHKPLDMMWRPSFPYWYTFHWLVTEKTKEIIAIKTALWQFSKKSYCVLVHGPRLKSKKLPKCDSWKLKFHTKPHNNHTQN